MYAALPPPQRAKYIAKVVLVTLGVGLPMSAFGENIMLRCDPMNSTAGPVVLAIDTSRKTVHWGKKPDSGWWIDRREHTETEQMENGVGDTPESGESAGYKRCVFNITELVQISTSTIEFETYKVNINECGLYGGWEKYKLEHKGDEQTLDKYVIERDTGFMSYYGKPGRYNDLTRIGDGYQCQRISGNAF